MAELSRIRNAGFKVRLLNNDDIGITPITSLTEVQRRWIITYKPALIAELKSEVANEPKSAFNVHVFRTIPLQTCGACTHFVRHEHPHLGQCIAKAVPEAICGLWDSDGRDYCYEFNAVLQIVSLVFPDKAER